MAKTMIWNENGWNVLQEADPEKHVLEMGCFCKDGIVTEIRCRHNDGEEEIKYTGALKDGYSLPMPLTEFAEAFKKGYIKLK